MVIIIAILAFGVLIAVHELGHFFAAKAFGVKVEEFALGMGPTILKKQGKETLYSLRAFPLGGFCAMEGEDEEVDSPSSFTSQKAWKRAIILCAGAFMNFVLGFVLCLCITPAAGFSEPVIISFEEGCPLQYEEGLQLGDRIHSIDGYRCYFTSNFSQHIDRSNAEYRDLVIYRDGRRIVLRDFHMPRLEYPNSDGSTSLRYGITVGERDYGMWANIKYSWYTCMDLCRVVWDSLGMLVSGEVGFRDMSGPAGVVDVVNDVAKEAESAEEAAFRISYIFALIAVNLAIMNLLPIPALDGGRIFFLIITAIIEKIMGRKLNPKYEGYIHTAGFVVLMGLMVAILFSDLLRAFFGI